MTGRKTRFGVIVALAIFAVAFGQPAYPQSFVYKTLDNPQAGTAKGEGTVAGGMRGDTIVGSYRTPNDEHGFTYDIPTNTFFVLDNPNRIPGRLNSGAANGIDASSIVGVYYDSNSKQIVGYLHPIDSKTWKKLADPGAGTPPTIVESTLAYGVERDFVVGNYTDQNKVRHGFLFDTRKMRWTTLDDPDAGKATYQGTIARGLTGRQIVGYYMDATNVNHGFVYDVGIKKWSTLDFPGATGTQLQGISDKYIVGQSVDSRGTHGLLYDSKTGKWAAIDYPNAAQVTSANGVSGKTIVGFYVDTVGCNHGFIATITDR
jgi:hypothetical protein